MSNKPVEAAPLAVFRILFGLLMCFSIIRFWYYGWIEAFYINPQFHFTFYGFEWVRPLGQYTYLLFAICAIAAFCVSLGYKYKLSIIVFFLSFTYIELMDKTTYLNHYYLVSILSFLMCFLPAASFYSADALRNPDRSAQFVPAWTINSIKLLLGIVYCYAGLAKLNSDWMLQAYPLKIWLPSKTSLPVFGPLLAEEWLHYLFSWVGALFDLTIVFFLLFRPTRLPAYIFLVVFHIMTWVLFPIGMFPFIMIVSTLIFFDSKVHKILLRKLATILRLPVARIFNARVLTNGSGIVKRGKAIILVAFFAIQLLFPWRYLLYPGELFWTEEGYRFSWRVMLMEKSGYAQFKIVDRDSGIWFYIDNTDFLTPLQEKQMAFQPDFILEYAHHLKKHFEGQGLNDVGVFVDSRVALNGRMSQPFIDPGTDLGREKESFKHKHWILKFYGSIKGI